MNMLYLYAQAGVTANDGPPAFVREMVGNLDAFWWLLLIVGIICLGIAGLMHKNRSSRDGVNFFLYCGVAGSTFGLVALFFGF